MKQDTFPVVRIYDDAFRAVDPALVGRYGRTREPDDIPEAPPGASPVVYHCRRLRRSQLFAFVEQAPNDALKYARAFAAGVVKITGGEFGEAGWSPEGAYDRDYIAMHEDEIDAAGIAPADALEVGQVVYMRSMAPKGSALRFRPLPSSLAVWEGCELHSAEQTRGEAAQSSSAPRGA